MKQNNQQRVLDMSAKLFNDFGIEAVSIGQIAQALKISPGNITYHFKRKTDLVTRHIDNLETLLPETIETIPVFSNPRRFGLAYMELLSLTYRYRFLFVGANYILNNGLADEKRYQSLIKTTKRSFLKQVNRLVEAGFMSEIAPPYSATMLVDSIWWQWLGWLLASQISPSLKRGSEKKMLAEAVLHIFFLNHHYVDPTFFRSLQRELKVLSR